MYSDSDGSLCNVAAMDKGFCEDILGEPRPWSKNQYTACSNAQAPLSQDSPNTSKDDDHDQTGPDPDKTATTLTVDTALSLSEECSTHIYGWPRRKEWQWNTTHKWQPYNTKRFHVVFCRDWHTVWWRLTDIIIAAWTVLTMGLLLNLM